MSTRLPSGGEDRDLQPVERAYRQLGGDEPPRLLDQAVLNRARRAADRRRPWSWNLGWYHTLGTAAGVLLAVGVYLQMRDEVPEQPPPGEPTPLGAAQQASAPEHAAALETEADAAGALKDRRRDVQPPAEAFALPAGEDRTAPMAKQPASGTPADLQAKQALRDQPLGEEQVPAAERWIERLAALRAAGEEDVFRQQLEAFQKAYPDYPLPADWTE